jgi:hypothetical protein
MEARSQIIYISIQGRWRKQEVFLLYAQVIAGNCWHHLEDTGQIGASA